MAVLLASASDLDDLVPTLVAYQIEWNKLRLRLRASTGRARARRPIRPSAPRCSAAPRTTGSSSPRPGARTTCRGCSRWRRERLNLRVRMLGGSSVGYARMTRRWWAPVRGAMEERSLEDRPMYFVSSNPHSMANLLSGTARRREDEVTAWVERDGPDDLRAELALFRDGRTDGSWENFLYFSARDCYETQSARRARSAPGRSGRSASRTSPRAPRCASPPR